MTPHEPARDTAGRFAVQDHSTPELTLLEQYLYDESDGSDFDIDAYYEVNANEPPLEIVDEESAFAAWAEGNRTPQGMDEYFDRPNPTGTAIAPEDRITIGAWGSEAPF